jgi:DNA-binding transcriptional regulator YdaS (Cro superfamily)
VENSESLFKIDARTPKTARKSHFAKLVGVTPARISQRITEGLPVEPNGRIDIAKGRQWWLENVDHKRAEAWKRANEAENPIVSKSRFAELVGLSPARISQLIAEGLPVEPDKRIDLAKGQQWLNDRQAADDGERPTRPAPLTARGQRDVAEAKIAGLKAERLAGRLIDLKATLRVVEGRARFERDAWIGWVNRAAPLLASEAGADMAIIVAILDREVRAQLAALAVQPLELPN